MTSSLKQFAQRVDRIAGHLNVLLVVLALGLAMLDLTLYVTENVVANLPPITVSDSGPPVAAAK